MSLPYRVALLGFSAFERGALASYFRLATHRALLYEQVERLDDSDFCVADADHAPTVLAVRRAQRLQQAVFIGSAPPDGASAWMRRPIDPLNVLRELDTMVALPAPVMLLPPTAPPVTGASDDEAPEGGFLFGQAPSAGSAAGALALLVDTSRGALRRLQERLQRRGLRADCATSGPEAMDLLRRQHYRLVVIDIDFGHGEAMDALSLCQSAKRQRRVAGSDAAEVVLLAAHHSEIDRARTALAGADAYLAKPLTDPELDRVLRRLDLGRMHQASPA